MTRTSVARAILAAACLLSLPRCRKAAVVAALEPETKPVTVVRAPIRSGARARLPVLIALHGHGQTEQQPASLWAEGYFYEPNFVLVSVRAPFTTKGGFSWVSESHREEFADANERQTRSFRTAESRVMAILDTLASDPRIDTERAFLMGISQGAKAASWIAQRNAGRFEGLALICGRFADAGAPGSVPKSLADMAVYIAAASSDAVLPPDMASETRDRLASAGADVRLFNYPGGHVITEPAIRAMQNHLGLCDVEAPEEEAPAPRWEQNAPEDFGDESDYEEE